MPTVDLSQDSAGLRRIFLALGLARPDEEVQARPLTGGVSSGIYRVDLRSGSYCVKQALPRLKVAKEWLVPVERVFAEIGYLRTVEPIVPGRVPRVLGKDEATRSFVMPFLGAEYRNWKADLLAGRIDAQLASTVGDILGRIHAGTADDAALAARFANDANFHALRLEPYLVETAREHPGLAGRLHALAERTAHTRRVLVHGDVSPKNILAGPSGPVLLDAECAWFGDPAFDVAFCLNHFLLKAAHLRPHAQALLAAYRSFADAYWPHVHWETRAALEARVATLLPGLALARIDGKSPVEYLSETNRAAVRRAAIPLLQDPPATLEDVARHWALEFAA
jgi:aminoglycoside phosphotransferase (APT) family kinase protein